MTPAWLRCALAPLFLATLCAAPASAQGLEGQVGRFYDDEGWDIYRLGMSRALTGPLGLGLQANYLQRAQGGDGALAGLSLDLTAFKGAGQGPYLVAGVGAGMGSSAGNDFSDAWGSWSVGGDISSCRLRSSPLRRKRVGGNCPWTRETVSKWPRASPSGSEAAAEDRPSRRPRRLPSFRHRRRPHPRIPRFLPKDGTRTACARPSSPRRRTRWAGHMRGVARARMAEDSTAPASSSTPTGSTVSGCHA